MVAENAVGLKINDYNEINVFRLGHHKDVVESIVWSPINVFDKFVPNNMAA